VTKMLQYNPVSYYQQPQVSSTLVGLLWYRLLFALFMLIGFASREKGIYDDKVIMMP